MDFKVLENPWVIAGGIGVVLLILVVKGSSGGSSPGSANLAATEDSYNQSIAAGVQLATIQAGVTGAQLAANTTVAVTNANNTTLLAQQGAEDTTAKQLAKITGNFGMYGQQATDATYLTALPQEVQLTQNLAAGSNATQLSLSELESQAQEDELRIQGANQSSALSEIIAGQESIAGTQQGTSIFNSLAGVAGLGLLAL